MEYSRQQLNARFSLEKTGLKKWDWILFGILGTICFFLFNQGDSIITAERSFQMLNGNFLHFYSACQEFTGDTGANYMPSTFWAYALWNLPLFILGKSPVAFFTSTNVLKFIWYKLFPVMIYFICAYLIYKLCREAFGFGAHKAKLAAFLFLSAPLAFYNQFIFSQYDSLTICFMLLGMRFYFKQTEEKRYMWLFAVCFGIAGTFKYYALFIFVVLLFLKEKRFFRILVACALAALPYLVEFLIYYIADRQAFEEQVLNFYVLNFANISAISVGFASLRLLPLILCVLAAWAYFTKVKDRRELIAYALFFCCGVSFALFSLMHWHPQWLIFGVPFWILSLMINKYYDVFIWLDSLFILLFYNFISYVFPQATATTSLANMALAPQLRYRSIAEAFQFVNFYRFDDTDLLFTIMSAILLVCFIWKHPKYCMQDLSTEFSRESQIVQQFFSPVVIVRIRFLVGVLGFLIPALICMGSMFQQPYSLWSRLTYSQQQVYQFADSTDRVEQIVTVPGKTVTGADIQIATYKTEIKNSKLILEFADLETGQTLGTSVIENQSLKDNEVVRFSFGTIAVEQEKQYVFRLRAEYGAPGEKLGVYYAPAATLKTQVGSIYQSYFTDPFFLNGVLQPENYLVLDVLGAP